MAFRRAPSALVIFWLLSTGSAWAHAYVIGAQPPINSGNQHVSGWIAVSFDEPVDLVDSNAVEVLGPGGGRIDRHDAKVDPADVTRVVVGIPSALRSGVYTVKWRVISADSHVVHGTYRIGVGVPVRGVESIESNSPFDPSSPLATLLRCVSLLGMLLATGATFLRIYALDRFEAEFPTAIAIARKCAIVGLSAMLAAWIPSVIVQAAAVSGQVGNDIGAVLSTTWGTVLFWRAGAGVAALLAVLIGPRTFRFLIVLPILVILATFSATGHAMAQADRIPRAVALTIDFAHLCAAGVWVGGIFVLTAILVPARRAGRVARAQAQTLLGTFTPAAAVSVGVVLATGIYASSIHVTTFGGLLASIYGRLLLAKVSVVAILLVFGLRHFRIGAGADPKRVGASMAAEAFFGVVVLSLTAALVGERPPGHGVATPGSPASLLVTLICAALIARFLILAKGAITVRTTLSLAAVGVDAMLALLAVAFLTVGVLGRLAYVSYVCMYPTLQLGDVIFVDRLSYELRPPHDGDIAVFRPPAPSAGTDVAQRVIGVGGDAIEITSGVVYRNGTALRESYVGEPAAYNLKIRDYNIYVDGTPLDATMANIPPKSMWQTPNRIPAGFFFMLGDNRNYSIDSHFWGFVQPNGIFAAGPLKAQRVPSLGKPLLVAWPLARTRLLERS